MKQYPKISVITPTFNQGHFIETTILSVIHQQYPNLEFIIFDGGSTDNTVAVIKKYEKSIHYWVSQKDDGQADAINQGFKKATGDIICWLNSDDSFLPGTLQLVANSMDINKEQIFAGNCIHIKHNSSFCYGSNVKQLSENHSIYDFDFLIQPSTFFTKKAWDKTGELNSKLTFCFDWDWFIRAQKNAVDFIYTEKYLSLYLLHDAHKSGSGDNRRFEEIKEIYRKNELTKQLKAAILLHQKKENIHKILRFSEKFGLQKFQHIFVKVRFPSLFQYRWQFLHPILNSLN
jgi:glycosyltransferase involved in cell wall biosynthesis